MANTKVTPKRKSKGKRHSLHAASLDRIADKLEAGRIYPTGSEIAKVFRAEAKHVRSILR